MAMPGSPCLAMLARHDDGPCYRFGGLSVTELFHSHDLAC